MMPHRETRPELQGPELLIEACRSQGVSDPRVVEAFRKVRRENFVPPEWVGEAYRDRPIPIPHRQVTTQPSLVALMVAGLRLGGDERVLEVGTGLGFQTAILSVLAAEVVSIERFPDLAERARRNLRSAGIGNVTVAVGDGTMGLPGRGPFQGIVVSAASPRIPGPLVEQLSDGGRLVHPLGFGGDEIVTAYRKQGERLVPEAQLIPAHFVRLVGAHGFTEDP